jgi:pimeloyl-ACP methyl ester carboxylesterase
MWLAGSATRSSSCRRHIALTDLTPWFFAFHGRTNDNVQARRYFGLEEAAHGSTIFVYPAALPDRTGGFAWADPADPPDAVRDFELFDVILDRITSTYCIDLDPVYVVGHSLGAQHAAVGDRQHRTVSGERATACRRLGGCFRFYLPGMAGASRSGWSSPRPSRLHARAPSLGSRSAGRINGSCTYAP